MFFEQQHSQPGFSRTILFLRFNPLIGSRKVLLIQVFFLSMRSESKSFQ
jgi:hypothetical protein